jgi:hypothetical protein
MSNAWLEARENRFSDLCSRFPHTKLSPLAACTPIRADLFEAYRRAIAAYDDASSSYAFTNVTPAGMMLPKTEVEGLFTDVARRFLDICDSLDIWDLMKAWNIPAIRRKNASPDPEHSKRAFISEDAHSDAWIGWGSDCLIFMTPVLGDAERNWVRFFRHPGSADSSWIERLPSFHDSKALAMAKQCEPLPQHYKSGYLYLCDISVIHQTIRAPDASWRVSMEMVGYFKEPPRDSLAYDTMFLSADAVALRERRKKFHCDLKMGQFAEYVSGKRANDVHLIDG